jgi:hypothetical protein
MFSFYFLFPSVACVKDMFRMHEAPTFSITALKDFLMQSQQRIILFSAFFPVFNSLSSLHYLTLEELVVLNSVSVCMVLCHFPCP